MAETSAARVSVWARNRYRTRRVQETALHASVYDARAEVRLLLRCRSAAQRPLLATPHLP